MPLPHDYWTAYERRVEGLDEYIAVVTTLGETWPERRFVWRGVANAGYALHSSLYRTGVKKHGALLREGGGTGRTFRDFEDPILEEARAWGLQRGPTDRLTALELLAGLQHQGVPTRLLDFSHNALAGLWFAT